MDGTTVDTVDGLREIYRRPSPLAHTKQLDHLDEHCRTFIAHSPFVVVGTADGDGNCDVSPKGGPPGFVAVLDERTLAMPDMYGNNRLDSLQNLVANPGIGMLFLIPGVDETLRVNGRASITTAPATLAQATVAGRVPKAALQVEVQEAYIHCAKALRRGSVWQPEEWPDTSDMPSVACMLRDHTRIEASAEDVGAYLEDSYRKTLWEVGGSDKPE
ncbi:MAG TPA: pyridoxamine 5'-phosphate oxidase family protein [Acidimicrobiales bacterium]|jgi:hypothetical protein